MRYAVEVDDGSLRIESSYFGGELWAFHLDVRGASTATVNNSFFGAGVNGISIDRGTLEVSNSTIESNNGINFASISSGSAEVTVRNSSSNRAFFGGGTASTGPRTLVVENSYFGSGTAVANPALTSTTFRNVVVDAGGSVNTTTEICTATIQGSTFLQSTCP